MALLTLDISHVFNFINRNEINLLQKEITSAHRMLIEKTGQGNDFLGWVNLPNEIDEKLFNDIAGDAQKIKDTAEIFVVVGIGGSYLGSRAVIEALSHNFSPFLKSAYPKIIFAGQNLSEDYMAELLEVLNVHSYALVVISKSGTTTEPAVAFRILKNHLEKKYGKAGARERILAITDKSKGALKKLADEEGYKTYVVPDDIGGRYSVLTPVGLLPIAVAGFDIRALVGGAAAMQKQVTKTDNIDENSSALYAATRNALYRSGKQLEIMVNYEPKLIYLTQWWKQLYGESEGKENKGIYPSGASFTTDLHSMGQYIQEGLRNIFETVLSVEKTYHTLNIPYEPADLDGLNYLSGKPIHYVNKMAELGTKLAHVEGGVPNIAIGIPQLNEEYLGQLIYFHEFACALSGYMLGINPFNQRGVEAYKKNMFALLGKPGYEKETEEIKLKIKQS
jgi:glucose-6-phosphate isomerase